MKEQLRILRKNSQPRPTLLSLARELGVSTCTVSNILNNRTGSTYSAGTMQRVKALAQLRGFIPNVHGRNLRLGKSMTIGVVLPAGMPVFTGALVELFELELSRHGYDTIVTHTTPKTERRTVEKIVASQVDGVLLLPQYKPDYLHELDLPSSLPIVIFERPTGDSRFPAVLTDNRCAARDLGRSVPEVGSICVLSQSSEDFAVEEREEGIRGGFGNKIQRIVTPKKYQAARDFILQNGLLVEGSVLVCLDYTSTIGVLWACRQLKLEIGHHIRLACFADLSDCELWEPTLCRVEHHLSNLTAEALRLLLQKLKFPSAVQPSEIRVPANIIWGNTFADMLQNQR